MRPNFKFALILSLFALLLFNSCQEEVIELTDNQEETFDPTSNVASLVRSTAANNGTVDDIMDNANCFSVNLPVTIVVNDITITINTLEDLAIIEEIFAEFNTDVDFLEFLFPITIILNDYTEIVIENQEQLQNFIEECANVEDDVIECVDFVYPISFSLYNSDFQIIDVVVIENDEQLYAFLEELEENNSGGAVLASLNFPVSLVYANGTTVEVNNNFELEAAINAAEENCNAPACDILDVEAFLLECHWNVVSYNGDDNLLAYDIYFNEDGTLEIHEGDAIIPGLWEVNSTDNGLVLTISELTALSNELEGDWFIQDCEEDRFELKRVQGDSITELVIERDCSTIDCSAQQIYYSLLECVWHAGSNATPNDYAGVFHFDEQIVVYTTPDGASYTGSWYIALTDSGIYLILELPEPVGTLSGEWQVIECDPDRIKFIQGDNYLVLEQDCSNTFDCPDQQANIGDECETPDGLLGVIDENCDCVTDNTYDCPDLQANFGDQCETANGTVGYIDQNCDCVTDNTFDCPDYQANIGDPCENPNGVSGVLDENCDCVTDTTYDCPDLQANVGDTCEDANGNLGVINANCECEVDTNYFECFTNTEMVVCDDDVVDGSAPFDLNLVYPNCPTDEVEITYHVSYADALDNVNPLTSPYVNETNPQVIYARVSLAGNPAEYEINEVHLWVENCNQACSEDQVFTYLTTCEWNPVSYNGSPDYSDLFMLFTPNYELIIEGNGMVESGFYQTASDNNGNVYVMISGFNSQNQVFIGEWKVVECTETQLVLVNNANNAELVLERTCP